MCGNEQDCVLQRQHGEFAGYPYLHGQSGGQGYRRQHFWKGRDQEIPKRFLAGLGFTPGTEVKAVSEASGNVILDVKGSKIAIDRKMASKILFCPES